MNYDNLFGMVEMEMAAEVIVKKIQIHNEIKKKQETQYSVTPIYLSDFKNDKEQIGFLHLIEYGYLRRFVYNGEFTITAKFAKRIAQREQEENEYFNRCMS